MGSCGSIVFSKKKSVKGSGTSHAYAQYHHAGGMSDDSDGTKFRNELNYPAPAAGILSNESRILL